MSFKRDSNQDFSEILKDFQTVFKECLLETKGTHGFDSHIDANVVGAFLINSWFSALQRSGFETTDNSLDDFRAFTIQQLSN